MTEIECVLGDITTAEVDAVVNAANSTLLGGGGVDGAIHAAAGPALLRECRELRATSLPDGLPVGRAVATSGGNLAARWVIHTVGPNWHRGQRDPALLASCHRESLAVAARLGARSVAFPAISAGVYGWDPAHVADIAVGTVRETLAAWRPTLPGPGGPGTDDEGVPSLDLVRFVLFSEATLREYQRARGAR